MFYRDTSKLPVPPRPRAVASLTWFIPAHLAAVRVINAACRDPWPAGRLAGLVDDPFDTTTVALRSGVVVAFTSYRIGPKGIDLLHFAVHPDHRNIGVGCQLFRALDGKLAAHARPRLTTAISELDELTFRWFARRGMRGVGVERDGMRPGIDRYRFEYRAADPTGIGRANCPEQCP